MSTISDIAPLHLKYAPELYLKRKVAPVFPGYVSSSHETLADCQRAKRGHEAHTQEAICANGGLYLKKATQF